MNMNKAVHAFLALAIAIAAPWPARHHAAAQEPRQRPAHWATPISIPGLPNLFRVSATLYRGAQPYKEGYAGLKKLGIKTIVNLRSTDSDREDALRLGIDYAYLPMATSSPEREKYDRFLRIAADPARQPVFVHCRHGADRTGTAVALYRIKIQKWSRDEAISEMTGGGYGFHEMFAGLKDFIRNYP